MDHENQKDYINEPPVEQKEDTYPDTLMADESSWNSPSASTQPAKSSQSTMALASLVMGILGIVTSCCISGGLLFGSLGILFALLSRTEERLEGYAKAGLITSIISLVMVCLLGIVGIILLVVAIVDGGGVLY